MRIPLTGNVCDAKVIYSSADDSRRETIVDIVLDSSAPLEGGGALVYNASVGNLKGKLKELYPHSLDRYIVRDPDTGELVVTGHQDKFDTAIESFRKSFLDMQKIFINEEGATATYFPAMELYEANNTLYIFMIFDYGKTFNDILKDSTADLVDILKITHSLCMGISQLHRNGYLHLDIKPSNFLVPYTQRPLEGEKAALASDSIRLFDIDGLRSFEDIRSGDSLPSSPGFAAPEQGTVSCFMGQQMYVPGDRSKISTATDIYGIGATLYYSLTGNCPGLFQRSDGYGFDELDVSGILQNIKNSVRRAELIDGLKNVLRNCLNEDSSKRYSNCDKLRLEIEELLKPATYLLRVDGKCLEKATIWQAAKTDYLAKLKGRFRGLGPSEIIEEIFPLGHQVSLDVQASTDDGPQQSVLDLIHEYAGEDILIVGAGGIGKTTALVKILQKEYSDEKGYDENTTVPIYVELNNAPEDIHKLIQPGDTKGSTFILRYIASLISNVECSEVSPEMLESLRDEFRKETAEPEYLLLLDGLNEVSSKWNAEVSSSVQGTLILEIRRLLKDSPNVRAIVTSRTEHNGIDSSGEVSFTKISLSGISDEMVYDYIKACNREDRIPIVENNAGLRECLHIPLFLMMYCGISGEYEDITSRGEIFRYFWNEVTEKYSQSLIAKNTSDNREMSAAMRMFILDFIAPALCDAMERSNSFSINFDDAEDIIKAVLSDDGDTGILGKYGKKCFEKYICSLNGYSQDVAEVAQGLAALKKSINRILIELTNMDVLYESGDLYGVRHHFFRDYFAAVHTVNSLRLAVFIDKPPAHSKLTGNRSLAIDSLNDYWSEPITYYRAIIIGEYLGEHRNKPVFNNGIWHTIAVQNNNEKRKEDGYLIRNVLNLYRNRFDGTDGYAVYSLLSIWDHVKVDLSGCDFSNLDLTRCNFNGIILGRLGLGSDFRGAKISSDNLFPSGHTEAIHHAFFSPGEKLILTSSADGTVKIWDASTNKTINTLRVVDNEAVLHAEYSKDSRRILTLSSKSEAQIWNAYTLDEEHSILPDFKSISMARYSRNGRWILAVTNGMIFVYDAVNPYSFLARKVTSYSVCSADFLRDDYKIIYSTNRSISIWNWKTDFIQNVPLNASNENEIKDAMCSPDDEKIIVTQEKSHYAIIINISTPEDIQYIHDPNEIIKYAMYSPNGKYIITVSDDYLKIWDADTLTAIGSRIGDYTDSIIYAAFNHSSNKVISTSYDPYAVIYNIPELSVSGVLHGHYNNIVFAKYSSCERYVVFAAKEEILIYDLSSSKVILTIGDLYGISSVDVSNDGKLIAAATEDLGVRIFDSNYGELILSLDGHRRSIFHVEFSADRKYILTVSADKTVNIWEIPTGELISTINVPFGIYSASFILNNKTIVVKGEDYQLYIIDLKQPSHTYSTIDLNSTFTDNEHLELEIFLLDNLLGPSPSLAVNPSGIRIAVGGRYDIAEYDISTDKTVVLPRMHSSYITTLSYSLDGEILASADAAGNVVLWKNKEPAFTISGHKDSVSSVCFSSDSRNILTASSDGTVKIWDISGISIKSISPGVISHTSGLIVTDCDFRNLHPESKLSDEDKAVLMQYGAIVD